LKFKCDRVSCKGENFFRFLFHSSGTFLHLWIKSGNMSDCFKFPDYDVVEFKQSGQDESYKSAIARENQ